MAAGFQRANPGTLISADDDENLIFVSPGRALDRARQAHALSGSPLWPITRTTTTYVPVRFEATARQLPLDRSPQRGSHLATAASVSRLRRVNVFNVHIVDSPWPSLFANAAFGLVGAVIGAVAVWWTAKRSQAAAARDALEAQREEWERQRAQNQRELLAKAADQLLDALWVKERELCDALHLARTASKAGQNVTADDEALKQLSQLELAIYSDLIRALPFVLDAELRERLRSAGFVVNGCLNLRAAGAGGSSDQFERAMIDVQRYFKWLRWNLNQGLQGLELPRAVDVLDVRRPQTEMAWQLPAGVPDYM
jgi:hypothetical protein